MNGDSVREELSAYTLEIRESGVGGDAMNLSEEIADPFIRTEVRPYGWRVAWAVLRGHYGIVLRVSATAERTTEVMKLNRQRPIWPNDVPAGEPRGVQ